MTDEEYILKETGSALQGRPHVVKQFADIVRAEKDREREWIEDLRRRGVKAAHPDDGWVDRRNDFVRFAYAQFDDGVNAGDVIALGWPDKYRLVRVLRAERTTPFFIGYHYFFEECR